LLGSIVIVPATSDSGVLVTIAASTMREFFNRKVAISYDIVILRGANSSDDYRALCTSKHNAYLSPGKGRQKMIQQ
jgi:hypothetical protein